MANARAATLLVFGCIVGSCLSVTVSSYLNSADQDRLRVLFSAASPYKDLTSAYWSLKGLNLLQALPKDLKAACEAVKSFPAESAEALFYLTEAAKLTKCAVTTSAAQQKTLQDALAEKKVSSIYFAYNAMKNSKMTVNDKDVNSALETALKTDEAPTSMAYAFMLTAALKQDVEKRYQLIEDVFAQADIVDNKYMQFEGGLFTTAIVVEASYQLAAQAKKAPTLKPDQVLQLSNYLLSRKHAGKLRSAVQLLSVIKTLSENQFHIPLAFSVQGDSSVDSSTNTKVSVKVGTLMGGSVGKLSLTADSARHIADDAIMLSKKQLAVSPSDPSVFELDFADVKSKPFGFYRLQLTASPAKADAKLLGLKGSVELKVVTSITLDSVKLAVADLDQSTPTMKDVAYPKKAPKLSADTHQKVVMTFFVKTKGASETLTPHQVFVRLTHQTSGQEIVFIPTYTDGTNQYKFELDVGGKEKDFGSVSGLYTMALLVGDAIVQNPIQWELADIDLMFSRDPAADVSGNQYKAKPVINHMFREPEKRPPAVVSNVFTILCLVPFLIMLVLWLRIGANVSDFPMSLSAIGFHLGVAAIFGLYYMYWTHLNMFETIKYLTILGIPTFLFGNQLLSSIAGKRKTK